MAFEAHIPRHDFFHNRDGVVCPYCWSPAFDKSIRVRPVSLISGLTVVNDDNPDWVLRWLV
jgi:hypothetical protein